VVFAGPLGVEADDSEDWGSVRQNGIYSREGTGGNERR